MKRTITHTPSSSSSCFGASTKKQWWATSLLTMVLWSFPSTKNNKQLHYSSLSCCFCWCEKGWQVKLVILFILWSKCQKMTTNNTTICHHVWSFPNRKKWQQAMQLCCSSSSCYFASVKKDVKLGLSSFSCFKTSAKNWWQIAQLLIVVLILVFCKTNEDDKLNLLSFYDVVKVWKEWWTRLGVFIYF